MTPTYEELLTGATRWSKSHKSVNYLLLFHGHVRGDEHPIAQPHPGIWCYYIIVPQEMYPHRWDEFACVRDEHGFEHPGSAWDYVEFDTGITWSSSEPYFCRHSKRMFDASKVGCDYNHLWQSETCYPDNFTSVNQDAIRTVESLLTTHPDYRLKSAYSHKWGEPDDFYTAINGCFVHKDDKIPYEWDEWKEADQ